MDIAKMLEWGKQLERIKESPVVKQFEAEEAHKLHCKRQALCEERDSLKAQADQELPHLQEAMAEAKAQAYEHYQHWQEARRMVAEAEGLYQRRSLEFGRQIDACDNQLVATADARIETFIDEIFATCEKERHTIFQRSELRGKKNLYTDKRTPIIYSNASAAKPRIQALFDVRKKAEALKREVLDEATVLARLDALRASIPECPSSFWEQISPVVPGPYREDDEHQPPRRNFSVRPPQQDFDA